MAPAAGLRPACLVPACVGLLVCALVAWLGHPRAALRRGSTDQGAHTALEHERALRFGHHGQRRSDSQRDFGGRRAAENAVPSFDFPATSCENNTVFLDWGSSGIKVYPVHRGGSGVALEHESFIKIHDLEPDVSELVLLGVLEKLRKSLAKGQHPGGAATATAGFRLRPKASSVTWDRVRAWNAQSGMFRECDASASSGCRTLSGAREAEYETRGMMHKAEEKGIHLGARFGMVSCGGASIQLGLWGVEEEPMQKCMEDLGDLDTNFDHRRERFRARNGSAFFSWLSNHNASMSASPNRASDYDAGGVNEMKARYDTWLEKNQERTNPCISPDADEYHKTSEACDRIVGKDTPCLMNKFGGYTTRLPGRHDSDHAHCKASVDAFLAHDEMLHAWQSSPACQSVTGRTDVWEFVSAFGREQQLGADIADKRKWSSVLADMESQGSSTVFETEAALQDGRFGEVLTSTLLIGFLRHLGLSNSATVQASEAQVALMEIEDLGLSVGWIPDSECSGAAAKANNGQDDVLPTATVNGQVVPTVAGKCSAVPAGSKVDEIVRDVKGPIYAFAAGTIVKVSCETGYEGSRESWTIKCNSKGEWSTPQPDCAKKSKDAQASKATADQKEKEEPNRSSDHDKEATKAGEQDHVSLFPSLSKTGCRHNSVFVDWGSSGMKIYPVHRHGNLTISKDSFSHVKEVKIPGMGPDVAESKLIEILAGLSSLLPEGHPGGRVIATAGFRLRPEEASLTWDRVRAWNAQGALFAECDDTASAGCATLPGADEAKYETLGMLEALKAANHTAKLPVGMVSCGGASIQLGLLGEPDSLAKSCKKDLGHLSRDFDPQRKRLNLTRNTAFFSWLANHDFRRDASGASDYQVGGLNEMRANYDAFLERGFSSTERKLSEQVEVIGVIPKGATNPCVSTEADDLRATGGPCGQFAPDGKDKDCLYDAWGGYITRLPGRPGSTRQSCRESVEAFFQQDEMLSAWRGSSACRKLAAGVHAWGFVSSFGREGQLGVDVSEPRKWSSVLAEATESRGDHTAPFESTNDLKSKAYGQVLTSSLLVGFLQQLGLDPEATVQASKAEVATEAMQDFGLAPGWVKDDRCPAQLAADIGIKGSTPKLAPVAGTNDTVAAPGAHIRPRICRKPPKNTQVAAVLSGIHGASVGGGAQDSSVLPVSPGAVIQVRCLPGYAGSASTWNVTCADAGDWQEANVIDCEPDTGGADRVRGRPVGDPGVYRSKLRSQSLLTVLGIFLTIAGVVAAVWRDKGASQGGGQNIEPEPIFDRYGVPPAGPNTAAARREYME